MPSKASNGDFDIIIVGGGLAGAALALALRDTPWRVALIERSAPDTKQGPAGFDERSLALAYGSKRIFEGLGVWSRLAAHACAIERIHISNRGHFGFTHLDRCDMGTAALGYVLPHRVLASELWEALRDVDNLKRYCPAQLSSLEQQDEYVQITLDGSAGSETLRARLLVAADGVRSSVRAKLGIQAQVRDYQQSAVVATVATTLAHQNKAYERFTETGPLALLPLPDYTHQDVTRHRLGLVWTMTPDQADARLLLDDAAFLQQLQLAFGDRLGGFIKVGRRQAFPLRLVRAQSFTAHRVALVGNAAHTLHPVAGQGFNLALRDVAVLAEQLAQGLTEQGEAADPGAPDLLQDYASWRRRDHQGAIGFTDTLARVFSHRAPPVALMRNLGLLALDAAPPLKRILLRHTMGQAGRLPRLAVGRPLTFSEGEASGD